MNLDELQSVQSRERQTDSLQQLRASFYEDAAEFVQNLREQRAEAAKSAEDPFDSPDINHLSDDIRTAEQTVEAIYERRVGKIVKMASLAAADMPTEQEGLTREEQELFETMVDAIEDHRERILAVLDGESPASVVASPTDDDTAPGDDADASEESTPAADAAATTAPDGEDHLDAAAMMGEDDSDRADTAQGPAPDPGAFEPPSGAAENAGNDRPDEHADATPADDSDESESAPEDDETGDADSAAADAPGDHDRTTVRITEDVGEIFGVDEREYDLAADDVVTLPTTNAEPLIERDAAEPIE